MGVLSFLASLVRESFSIFILQSEVDASKKDKYKLVMRKVFVGVLFFALALMTNRAIHLSSEFAKYRKMHKEFVEQCQSKNQSDASSDSGNGLKPQKSQEPSLKDNWERSPYELGAPSLVPNSESVIEYH